MVTASAAGRGHASVPGAGLVLGVGLGAFLDGIVLHQILQWHNMLSSRVPPVDLVSVKFNMIWDGVFHAFAWLVTVAGVWMLARARPGETAGRVLVGAVLAGWGLFNLVEGLVDHQLLGLHHVHPGRGQLAWDLGFLASGPILVAIGWLMARRRSPAPSPPADRTR